MRAIQKSRQMVNMCILVKQSCDLVLSQEGGRYLMLIVKIQYLKHSNGSEKSMYTKECKPFEDLITDNTNENDIVSILLWKWNKLAILA